MNEISNLSEVFKSWNNQKEELKNLAKWNEKISDEKLNSLLAWLWEKTQESIKETWVFNNDRFKLAECVKWYNEENTAWLNDLFSKFLTPNNIA